MAFNSIYDGIGVNELTSLIFLLPKFKLVAKLKCESASINISKLKDIFDNLHPLQVFHILKLIDQVSIAKKLGVKGADGSVIEDVLDPFIVLIYTIYKQLDSGETHKLLLQLSGEVTTPPCCEGIKVFDYLIDANKMSAENLQTLKEFFVEHNRKDLLENIKDFEEKFIHDGVYNWHSKVIGNQHTQIDGDISSFDIDFKQQRFTKITIPFTNDMEIWKTKCIIEKQSSGFISFTVKAKYCDQVELAPPAIPLVVKHMSISNTKGESKDIVDDGSRSAEIFFSAKILEQEIKDLQKNVYDKTLILRWLVKSTQSNS